MFYHFYETGWSLQQLLICYPYCHHVKVWALYRITYTNAKTIISYKATDFSQNDTTQEFTHLLWSLERVFQSYTYTPFFFTLPVKLWYNSYRSPKWTQRVSIKPMSFLTPNTNFNRKNHKIWSQKIKKKTLKTSKTKSLPEMTETMEGW